MKTVLQWVVIVIALAIASGIGKEMGKELFKKDTILNPFPKTSRLYEPYQRFEEKLLNLPEFKQYFKNVKSEDEAFQIGYALPKLGLRRLDDISLEKRMKIFVMMLDKFDIETCATIVRGSSLQDQQRFYAILESLDTDTINEYFDLAFNAIVAELRKYPEIVVSEQEVLGAMNNLFKRLSAKDLKKLINVLNNFNSSSDHDVCWAGKVVYQEILKMNPEDKRILVRAFVLK